MIVDKYVQVFERALKKRGRLIRCEIIDDFFKKSFLKGSVNKIKSVEHLYKILIMLTERQYIAVLKLKKQNKVITCRGWTIIY